MISHHYLTIFTYEMSELLSITHASRKSVVSPSTRHGHFSVRIGTIRGYKPAIRKVFRTWCQSGSRVWTLKSVLKTRESQGAARKVLFCSPDHAVSTSTVSKCTALPSRRAGSYPFCTLCTLGTSWSLCSGKREVLGASRCSHSKISEVFILSKRLVTFCAQVE